MTNLKEATPRCDSCGTDKAILYRHNTLFDEFKCPACLRKQATFDGAYDHLQLLMEQAARDWLAVWQGSGFKIDLDEYMSMIAQKVQEKYAAGELTEERPSPCVQG